MNILETVLIILLVVDAIALGVLVLLQQGKGADVGAAFGSGSSNTLFGSTGSASFLTKATVFLSIAFFVISFGLAYMAKERAAAGGSIGLPEIEELPAFLEDEDVDADEDAGVGEDAGVDEEADADEDADVESLPDDSDTELPDV